MPCFTVGRNANPSRFDKFGPLLFSLGRATRYDTVLFIVTECKQLSAAGERPTKLDLIWGANAIAAALGLSRRRTFYLLERGQIPCRKVGGRWVVERAALARHFDPGATVEPSGDQL